MAAVRQTLEYSLPSFLDSSFEIINLFWVTKFEQQSIHLRNKNIDIFHAYLLKHIFL